MKRFIHIMAVLATVFFSNLSLGGTRDPNVSDSKYLEYGEQFHFVHGVCGMYTDDSLFCASSVSIEPKWILTAAHVVKDAKTCFITHKDEHIIIKEIIIHPDFNSDKFGKGDIALCYLEKDLQLDFYPELYDKKNETGKLCSISGFGSTGTFDNGMTLYDGKRRSGSNFVDYVLQDLLICSPSINMKKTSLEFLICTGDSGGGLFIENKLAGINSCILAGQDKKPNGNYGDESGHTRVSLFVDWIKENIKKKK